MALSSLGRAKEGGVSGGVSGYCLMDKLEKNT